jgi:hypothetical protein
MFGRTKILSARCAPTVTTVLRQSLPPSMTRLANHQRVAWFACGNLERARSHVRPLHDIDPETSGDLGHTARETDDRGPRPAVLQQLLLDDRPPQVGPRAWGRGLHAAENAGEHVQPYPACHLLKHSGAPPGWDRHRRLELEVFRLLSGIGLGAAVARLEQPAEDNGVVGRILGAAPGVTRAAGATGRSRGREEVPKAMATTRSDSPAQTLARVSATPKPSMIWSSTQAEAASNPSSKRPLERTRWRRLRGTSA